MNGLMAGKRGLIMGLANDRSLAWGIAKALHVHPQTVSGRINRLKDLLADEPEGPRVRAELLVLR